MSKDYYSTLGVGKSATSADIKKAYRNLSKEWHPDKHKGDKAAESKFKEINEAYEILGNEKRRKQYDTFGSTGGPGGGGAGFGGFDFSGFQQGDMGDLGDIFSSFFGGGGGGRGRKPDNRGSDLQVRISIDFAEVVNGVSKTIAIEKLAQCKECDGTGAEGGSVKTCTECNGTGQITRTAQSFFGVVQQSVQCAKCEGKGKIPETPCKACSGEGRKREKTQLTIDVPAGIDDGQTLRITGEGNAGSQGAPAGDLFVIVQVTPDKRFIRDGNDIRSEVSVSVVDATLGTEVSVPTVHGEVTLKIPTGTQPGTVMRLKSKGVPQLNSSRLGDHYVTVQIDIPRKLSRAEKKLFEQLREAK
ncbi:MAG: molecular chaperone DnaJ [Candidatus Peribacteraceae bacterium]|nr:molecular chaperone DnaJ [Candidatus Peribacteraceae bacterium]|tara:strand:- start:5122 stop:6195 length:1074 start_codon:yes stop_codon:yes gene_type:complete